MLRFVARNIASTLVLALAVTTATFLLIIRNATGSVRALLGPQATDAQVSQKVNEMGLDLPAVEQYFRWLLGTIRGDLGNSYISGEAVTTMLSSRLPVTLSLVVLSLIITTVAAAGIGAVAAVYGGWIDRLLQILGIGASAIPNIIVAVGLVFVFAIKYPLLPATGYVSPETDVVGWGASLALPVCSILVGTVAAAAQQFRGAMIDVLGEDYIRTLRAAGLSERAIVLRHVLRGAATPGLTIISLQAIGLLGGVVIIERIFGLPGLGSMVSDAALRNDIPVILGGVLLTVAIVSAVNILITFLTGWVNPKARIS